MMTGSVDIGALNDTPAEIWMVMDGIWTFGELPDGWGTPFCKTNNCDERLLRHVTFRWTCRTKSSLTTGRLFQSAAPPFLCRSSTPHHESVTWTHIVRTQSIWLDHKIQHSHTTLILVPFQQMFRLYFLHLYSSLMHNRSHMLWPCGPSQGPESFMSPTHRTAFTQLTSAWMILILFSRWKCFDIFQVLLELLTCETALSLSQILRRSACIWCYCRGQWDLEGPFGGGWFGYLVNMWSMVCNGSPHSHWTHVKLLTMQHNWAPTDKHLHQQQHQGPAGF